MFEFIKKLFGKKKAEEETAMEETKVTFTPLEADDELKDTEMPASRYTKEYAEFVESTLDKAPEKTLEEEMLDDPFADVAAQDEDFGVPDLPETKEIPEETPAEETAEESLEEQMKNDPFADLSAEYDEEN